MLLNWVKPAFFYWAVFAFYAFALLIPNAFALFAVVLVGLCLVIAALQRPLWLFSGDALFAFFLAVFPLLMIPSWIVKGGSWNYFDYPVRALLFAPLIVGMRNLVNAEKLEAALFSGAATGGVLSAVFSLSSLLLHPGMRVGLPITNPIAFGQIAAILAIISMAGYLDREYHQKRFLFAAGILASVFTVLATGSGGSLLGLAVGMSLQIYLFYGAEKSFKIKAGFCLIVLLSVIILAPLCIAKYQQVVHDLSSTIAGYGMGTSQGQRLIMWSMALEAFAQHPVFGIGPGHGHDVFVDYCLHHFCTVDFSRFHGVHNQYLDVLMNTGSIGLLGWAIFIVGISWLFARRLRCEVSNAKAAATGLSVFTSMCFFVITQGLYHHNIFVILFFFTITFFWFLATSQHSLQPS